MIDRVPFVIPEEHFWRADLPESLPFETGKSQLLISNHSDVLFIGYGNGVGRAAQTMAFMDEKPSLLDLRFVKPFDTRDAGKNGKKS